MSSSAIECNVDRVSEEKTKWQLVNIALPIVLVVLFGLAYQQLRKRRYTRAKG